MRKGRQVIKSVAGIQILPHVQKKATAGIRAGKGGSSCARVPSGLVNRPPAEDRCAADKSSVPLSKCPCTRSIY